MNGTATVTVNQSPAAYNVTGGGAYCSGGNGMLVGLDGSDAGVNYQLYDGGTAGAVITSGGGSIDFGLQTDASTYTVIATNVSSGCATTMSGSATISINPLPDVFTVSGGGTFCASDTGAHVFLSSSVSGINYQLYNGETTVSTLAGTGSGLDYGLQTAGGTYTIVATDATTSCTNTMTGNAILISNPLPNSYNVTGGGAYCAGGTGYTVGLDGSDDGMSYQLYNNLVASGDPFIGFGSSFDFATETNAGTYTVIAADATTGCTAAMAGNAVISVNPLPEVFTVSGGGTFCASDTGAHVFLSSSVSGINYQLFNGETTVSTLAGNGSGLDYGLQTSGGTYTVVATDAVTTCTNNMAGNVLLISNPLPAIHNVIGGGSYCAGGTGVAVGLDGSDAGISYQLYDGVAEGVAMAGTTSALAFGSYRVPTS